MEVTKAVVDVWPHLHLQPGFAAPPAARPPYDRKTFYGDDVAGYTDYPFQDAMAPA
jgi:hypothetical protein